MPLAAIGDKGLRLNYGVSVYSPRLEGIDRRVVAPLAQKATAAAARIKDAVRPAVEKVKGTRPVQQISETVRHVTRALTSPLETLSRKISAGRADRDPAQGRRAERLVHGCLLKVGQCGDRVGAGLREMGQRLSRWADTPEGAPSD